MAWPYLDNPQTNGGFLTLTTEGKFTAAGVLATAGALLGLAGALLGPFPIQALALMENTIYAPAGGMLLGAAAGYTAANLAAPLFEGRERRLYFMEQLGLPKDAKGTEPGLLARAKELFDPNSRDKRERERAQAVVGGVNAIVAAAAQHEGSVPGPHHLGRWPESCASPCVGRTSSSARA